MHLSFVLLEDFDAASNFSLFDWEFPPSTLSLGGQERWLNQGWSASHVGQGPAAPPTPILSFSCSNHGGGLRHAWPQQGGQSRHLTAWAGPEMSSGGNRGPLAHSPDEKVPMFTAASLL